MVNFVGAGCGAVDLITVRGKKLLEEADVVIYAGSLVNPELLNYTRADCQVHNSANMTLDEVIETIRNAEKSGKIPFVSIREIRRFMVRSVSKWTGCRRWESSLKFVPA